MGGGPRCDIVITKQPIKERNMTVTKEKILAQLSQVAIAGSDTNVVSAGLISGVTIQMRDGRARVGFLLAGDATSEELRQQCEGIVQILPEVAHVTAVLTAHSNDPGAAQTPRKAALWNHEPLAGVDKVITVASGKGGVGKSSIATLLALAMAAQKKRIGLLDADIYGPSVPTMLGVKHSAEIKGGMLIPEVAHGICAMSMEMIIGDQAAVMRAPRVTKALQQMLRQTAWAGGNAPLDMLIVDMPPGTGDVHLSMVQQTPLAGAVIITLASNVATMDAKKSIEMFKKVNVPILGIIENMSYMEGGATPFGSGGGEYLAADTGYPLLAKLPLEPKIGELLNQGKNPFEMGQQSELLDQVNIIASKLLSP